MVAKLFVEGFLDYFKGPPVVVICEILHVFKKKRFGTMMLENTSDVEKRVPWALHAKPCARPSAIFFDTPAIEKG